MPLLDDKHNLTFGSKYKGRNINEVITKDPSYAYWLKQQKWVQKDEILVNLLKPVKEPPITIPFGKYKGKTPLYIYGLDEGYFNWLKEECSFIRDNKKLYAEICKYT